jgi:hypothetical protein
VPSTVQFWPWEPEQFHGSHATAMLKAPQALKKPATTAENNILCFGHTLVVAGRLAARCEFYAAGRNFHPQSIHRDFHSGAPPDRCGNLTFNIGRSGAL